MPALPALEMLSFRSSSGLNEPWQFGNVVLDTNIGLNFLWVDSCGLDDSGFEQMLNWIIPSSNESLQILQIAFNNVGTIPEQLKSFPNLESLAISHNWAELTIPKNSIIFYGGKTNDNGDYISNVYFGSSHVVHVEPGAFQGNFSFTNVDFVSNSFKRFEEGVFKSMLQDLSISPWGFLDIRDTPIDCSSDPCHLNWLLVDNRPLLSKLIGSQCEDGTSFENLSPDLFKSCNPAPNNRAVDRPTFKSHILILIITISSVFSFN